MHKISYANWILIIFMGMLVVLNLVVIPQIHKGSHESGIDRANHESRDPRS